MAFPATAVTAANLLIAANRKTAVLNGPLTDTATTVNVDSTSGFGSTGVITVESEIIHYTGTTPTTLTGCTRGYDGTSGAYHSGGTVAYARCIAAHHNLLATEIAALESALCVTAAPTFAGLTLTGHLLFTDATYDIGASGATRPRDLFLSRNASIPGTLAVTGTSTLTGLVGIGAAVSNNAKINIGGSMTGASGACAVMDVNTNLTGIQAQDIYGVYVHPTLTRAASGTAHPVVAGLTAGAPTLAGTVAATIAASLYIPGPPSGGVANYSLYVASGSPCFVTPLVATSGGTGQSVYAVGDLLYASTTTVLSKLAAVAVGQVLCSAGVNTAPAWSATPSVTGYTATGVAALTTAAESWVGPSSTTGMYFKGGNVGIGTTAPGTKLELGIGTLANGGYNGIKIAESGANVYLLQRKSAGAVYYASLFNDAAQSLVLQEAGGNVGIGTTNPGAKLHLVVNESTSAGDGLIIGNDAITDGGTTLTPNTWIKFKLNSLRNAGAIVAGRDSVYGNAAAADSNLQFYTAVDDVNTERMRITSNGNVGIGTTNPAGKFVLGDLVNTYLNCHPDLVFVGTSFDYAAGVGAHARMYSGVEGGAQWQYAYLRFQTHTTNSSTLTDTLTLTGGNVGIGTTGPAAKLAINGGLHVGGDTDPGDNNALIDGTGTITGAFGCNGKTAQTAYASGGAASTVSGTATLAGYGFANATEMNNFVTAVGTIVTLVNNHRLALIADGIES